MNKLLQLQRVFLYPLSLVYGIVTWVRNRMFDYKILKSKEFTIPVISVGNITVGGTGKTPHIEYLVSLLKDEFKIATLSRGYMRKTSGFFLADESSTVDLIGDEPLQIKRKFNDIAVAVDGNRVRGITKLLQIQKNLNTILLDDAFQHRYVQPGLSILLVDFNNPLSSDYMLPFGRMREAASERLRADIIIVTKCPNKLKPIEQRLLEKELKMYAYQKVFFTTLAYGEPVPVFKNAAKAKTFEELKEEKPALYLLTGIANHRPLKTHIRGISTKIEELNFPDHHNYTARDMHLLIEKFSALPVKTKYIITTEKDAMRLQQFSDLEEDIKSAMYYIPVKPEFVDNEKEFNHIITSYVRNNKPDNILHKPKINK